MKDRWQLSVTASEAARLEELLEDCVQVVSPQTAAIVPPVIRTTTSTASNTTTIDVREAEPGSVVLVSCDRFDEVVTIANPGGEPVSLSGYVLHDEGNKHSVSLGASGTLAPGSVLKIQSGPDAAESETSVVWKRSHVWNNDGDTAYLVAPGGQQQTTRC